MTTDKYTIFGSTGFIGSHLADHLKYNRKKKVLTPQRRDIFRYKNLGNAFYCIGMTADFRSKPFETIEAHVCVLKKIIKNTSFNSFTYLSSTRVYGNQITSKEDRAIRVNPIFHEDLYNISKILGESICFACKNKNVRVVRLSNVYGYDLQSENFLASIIKDAVNKNAVELRTSLDSERDYICIDDVVKVLPEIAENGMHKIYNVASGINTSNRLILKTIVNELNCKVTIKKPSQLIKFPVISTARIQKEFNFKPKNILHDLPDLLAFYKKAAYR